MVRTQNENVICIIPARGGSVAIKNKNLRILGRKPLLVHSVNHALDSGIPKHRIVISSDSDEILEWGGALGIESYKRPDDISGPVVSSEESLIYTIELMDDLNMLMLNNLTVVMLQVTSPIRLRDKDSVPLLKRCLKTYLEGDYDSLLTVTKFEDFFWTEMEVSTGKYEWMSSYNPQKRPMRQELGREGYKYFDCGNIYMTDVKVLLDTKCRIGKKPCIFPISSLEGLQIDTMEDLELFRKIYLGDMR